MTLPLTGCFGVLAPAGRTDGGGDGRDEGKDRDDPHEARNRDNLHELLLSLDEP